MQRTFQVNKLIRDKIPNAMNVQNVCPRIHILDTTEHIIALKRKLIEESNEVMRATTTDEVCEELGDVMEVMQSIAKIYNIN